MMSRRKPALHLQAVAFALLASLLVVLGLAANPHWHESAHHHGDTPTHEECAVDLFASGSVDGPNTAPLLSIVAASVSPALPMATVDIPSSFLTGSILEHAPPARR